VIPEYTVNTSLDWRATDRFGMLFSVTFYGEQRPMKLDFKGDPVRGTSADTVKPYALVNLSGNYAFSKDLKLTAGINNLFDKRQFRRGNSVSVTSTPVHGTSGGAGAATYNEPGRTLFVSMTSTF